MNEGEIKIYFYFDRVINYINYASDFYKFVRASRLFEKNLIILLFEAQLIPKGAKQKIAIKAGILILVVMPKLQI